MATTYTELLLTDDSPKASHPDNFGGVVLKPYQLSSIHRMLEMEAGEFSYRQCVCNTRIGIEASQVGSGKTLTCIGLVRAEAFPQNLQPQQTNWMSAELVSAKVVENFPMRVRYCPATLIVIPNNLETRWKEDLAASATPYVMAHTVAPKTFAFETIAQPIVLCLANKFNDWISKVNAEQIFWHRVILDEADHNYVPSMRRMRFRFVWMVTFTFENLFMANRVRHHGFVADTFRDSRMHEQLLFRSIVVKNCDKYINTYLNLPALKRHTVQCRTPAYVNIVNSYMSAGVASMINAGNVEDAIKELGGNIIEDKDVVQVFIRNKRDEVSRLEHKLANMSILYPRLSKRDLEEKELMLRRAVDDIKKVISNIASDMAALKQLGCPLCECEYEDPVVIDCCSTITCLDCMEQCLMHTRGVCPLCNATGKSTKSLQIMGDMAKMARDKSLIPAPAPKAKGPPTKEEAIADIIGPTKRVLIFSAHKQSFNLIQKTITDAGLKYAILMGRMSAYDKLLKQFADGEVNVLCLSAEHSAAGLNITAATDVIIYHALGPALEAQVVGRGQRMGRRGHLNVWHLVYQGETAT
jgi:hypothetical protein